MIHKTYIKDWTREEWLAERRKSLGGSDIGSALGLCKWRSPYAVWAEKTGLTPEEPDNEAMRQGRDLEEYVAERFSELTGKKVRRVNAILRNDDFPHLHANIDRDIVGEDAGLECKTASALNTSRFRGAEFPASYYTQCVTYLAVTGYKRWYLAVLVLGREFKVYQVTTVPDDEVPEWCAGSVYVGAEEFDSLKAFAAQFWEQYVETKTPPPVDGSESTAETIETIFAESDDAAEEIDLTAVADKLTARAELKEQKERIEAEITEAENAIKAFMETAPRGVLIGANTTTTVTWKTQESRRFDAKAFAKDHPGMDLTPYYTKSQSRPFRVITKEI